MSKKSIQKMSEKEIQQKIKKREKTKKIIEAKIERLKNQLKLESNSTTIPQKIKILEYNKQYIEAKIEKLQNQLKKLESTFIEAKIKRLKNQLKLESISTTIPQKIKILEYNKQHIEAKIERLKNQLKLESNSTTIPQKIKILEHNKQYIEAKIEKLQNRLKELESKVLKSNSKTKEKPTNQAKKIKTQEYFTDASQRNGKTKIAIYSPTKDIKQAKQIANCNTAQAEFLAIQWALSHANSNKENAIIYNDNSSSIEKAKKEFKEHKNIEFLWIPRKENKIADKLARG